MIRYFLHAPLMYHRIAERSAVEAAKRADMSISIGGDNYCYGSPYWLYAIDQAVKEAGKQLVLWGCSIEPDDIFHNKEMQQDLAQFDLITPRESITYGALLEAGIGDNVYLHADPAFVMQPEEVDLPAGWEHNNVIGINLSPLILRYQNPRGSLKSYVQGLVRHILESTDYKIALIPHVIQLGNNDWDVLHQLYKQFSQANRLILLGRDLNGPQTKHIISQCHMFVGARTHSTIAAYSSCVPTLALSYSVKARGIARDIFGSEEGLVLPVQDLTHERQLIRSFEELCERENDLRQHLIDFMPAYCRSSWASGERLVELLPP